MVLMVPARPEDLMVPAHLEDLMVPERLLDQMDLEHLGDLMDLEHQLVLMDLQMPGMTGLQVLTHVPQEQLPLVVFVTAYDRYAVEETTCVVTRAGDVVDRHGIVTGCRVPETADLLERTRFTTRSVLKEAKRQWSDITRLLLVGGSTRMPMVQTMLEEESGLKVERTLSPDEAVAHGAALYAGLLMARQEESQAARSKPAMSVRNVSSHDLGVLSKDPATGRPMNSVMIPRNTTLPATRGKRFRTAKLGQKNIVINVIEGGDSAGRNSTPIGRCTIHELPEDLPAGTVVEVYFTYAENGRLKVEGRLPDLNRKAVLSIERASGLNDDKLDEWGKRLKAGRTA